MKFIYGIFLLGAICGACCPKITTPAITTDSVKVIIKERVVKDTVVVEIPVEKQVVVTKDTISVLETKYAKSSASVSEGYLNHSLESKPEKIFVPVVKEVRDTIIIKNKADTIIVKENYVTKWQSFSMVLGWILGGILILLMLYKLLLK